MHPMKVEKEEKKEARPQPILPENPYVSHPKLIPTVMKVETQKPPVEEKPKSKEVEKKELKTDTSVHIFYYPWYGNPAVDNGTWYHWNHRNLPHWDKKQAGKWPQSETLAYSAGGIQI